MATAPIINPEIPYVGPVEGGLTPGKMVKIQGRVPPNAVRFAVNYQLGPTLNPRDDIALHVSPRFPEGFITRNHIESMTWGMEMNSGPMWIQPGQDFEMILLCEPYCYKIAINGRHFTEFAHRLPYPKVTHLVIDGDVEVKSISYEVIPVNPPGSSETTPLPDIPPATYGPPPPGGIYPTLGPQHTPEYGPTPPADYGPPPYQYGPGNYNPPRAYGYQPGYEKAEEEDTFGGCLDKAGLAIGGLVAAGGAAAALYALNKNKDSEKDHEKTDASKSHTESESGGLGNLGALGAALASSLASNALQNSNTQQGYPLPQPSGGGGGGGVLGSILGALGSGGASQQAPPSAAPDTLNNSISSILSGIMGRGGSGSGGGGGNYQPSGGYPPQGGYQSGYGQQQNSGGSDLLSGLGSAIGSSLFNSAIQGLSKREKNKSEGENHTDHPPVNYETPRAPSQTADRSADPPPSEGHKLTADEISKGLGLDD